MFFFWLKDSDKISLEVEAVSWHSILHLIPSSGTIKVVADWQGIHVIVIK